MDFAQGRSGSTEGRNINPQVNLGPTWRKDMDVITTLLVLSVIDLLWWLRK